MSLLFKSGFLRQKLNSRTNLNGIIRNYAELEQKVATEALIKPKKESLLSNWGNVIVLY